MAVEREGRGPADLCAVALRPWLDAAAWLAGGLLYLDEGAGEAAAAGIGLPALLGLGAANVCSLDGAERFHTVSCSWQRNETVL
jgi:hypothetical protein